MSTEIAEAELVQETGITLFQTDNPVDVIAKAQELAAPLAQLIDGRRLFTKIGGKKHVRIEGWTLLGSMLGVFPVTEWTREIDGGWEARVTAQTRAGEIVGAAEAECLRSEANWKNRDDYALRSMAQTRAASKALRLPLGFIMELGGYSATPAEEMDGIKPEYAGPPCPHCESPVIDQRESAKGTKKPLWKCSNWDCGGGDAKKDGDGNWPWASWDPYFFKARKNADGLDPVDAMYAKLAEVYPDAEPDGLEACVYEAALGLGVDWPSQEHDRDTLNELFRTARRVWDERPM